MDAGMRVVSGVCGAPCAPSEAMLHEEQAAAAPPMLHEEHAAAAPRRLHEEQAAAAPASAPAPASMLPLQAGIVHGWGHGEGHV